jgi:hypothetical protein
MELLFRLSDRGPTDTPFQRVIPEARQNVLF